MEEGQTLPDGPDRTHLLDKAEYEQAVRRFCRSMTYFRLAESLRLRIFADDPTGLHYFASGHSARQMIRVGLKLEQQASRVAAETSAHGFFARRSRHMANVLTRHLFRYPRERASMLILESTMVRLLSAAHSRELGLRSARGLLDRAEPVVLGLGVQTRVRMRFVLERIKVHRRMADNLASSDLDGAKGFAVLAREDINLLEELNRDPGLMLWHKLIQIQKDYLSLIALD